MIAAEQWYEYQKQYQKYGLDMKPRQDETVRERVRKQREAKQAKGVSIAVRKDRGIILSLVLVGALVMIMVVVLTAYAAKVNYDINEAKAANDVLIGEIEDLNVELLGANGIGYIEEKAESELGMKTPGKNCIYISSEDAPEKGFAGILKDKAYN